MLQDAAREVPDDVARISYLAIRQPAVIRHLESTLLTRDGDAFGAGLALACRLLEQMELTEGAPPPRLDGTSLTRAAAAVGGGAWNTGDVERVQGWIAAHLGALSVVLTADEERRVDGAIAALVWALAERRGIGDDDRI
jgi:hypothetical protein